MVKVLVYQFQKIFVHIYTRLSTKSGFEPYNFSFYIFFFTILLIFFIDIKNFIIRYIFFLVGKLFPKPAILKGFFIYFTNFLENFLVSR